ncbi:hypothetical protein [Actinomadura rugatobispora]|uniref:Uncharacterized protein n=1 Tax=Actinomadura rugatobispora TaxID=1994 RepID=A0ABW0ZYY7_9ACTN|nr:hypothetical protein GCM10010200_087040 [Actinomadura rugatobispora]
MPRKAARGSSRGIALAASLVPAVVILAVLFLDLTLQRTTTLKQLQQPSTIQYPDESQHYIGLQEGRSLIFGRVVEHQIYAGRDSGLGYGHFVEIELPVGDRPVLKDAVWEPAGVRARFASGHELFVPARSFMYGR